MAELTFPHPYIIGSDEVGFGCWAGDLYVCATIVPAKWDGFILGGKVKVRDSKQMTKEDRELAHQWALQMKVLHWVEIVTAKQIDERGARKSLIAAHVRAIGHALEVMRKIGKQASIVADGTLPIEGVISIPKADDKVPAVSLASCIAKVMRDAYMVKASKKYPAYGFEENMGYGVPKHQAALEEFGPCEIHRMSYGPVKKAASRLTEPKNMWEMDE